MSIELLALAILMAAVTYPARALPLLVPGMKRLPPLALAYLRLVGPAVLAALAAVNTFLAVDDAGRASVQVSVKWFAVGLCAGLVAWRRNLFVGLIAAVALAVGVRALGLA